MRKLLLLTIALGALFITQTAQANEAKLTDMKSYISLANLERVTAIKSQTLNINFKDINAVIEQNLNEETIPTIWNFENQNTI